MRIRFMMLMAAAMTCSAFAVSVAEAAFQITPTTYSNTGSGDGNWDFGTNAWSGTKQGNPNVGDVEFATGYDPLFTLYKADFGTPVEESGAAAPYYITVFDKTLTNPSEATITHNGNQFIDAGQTYLVVKGGLAFYIFDLTFLGWTGLETLQLTGFMGGDRNNAISHVEIYAGGTGGPDFLTEVPEPASMALWLTVAAGGAFARRRRMMAQA